MGACCGAQKDRGPGYNSQTGFDVDEAPLPRLDPARHAPEDDGEDDPMGAVVSQFGGPQPLRSPTPAVPASGSANAAGSDRASLLKSYDGLVGSGIGLTDGDEARELIGRHVTCLLQRYAAENTDSLDAVLQAAGFGEEHEVVEMHRDLSNGIAHEVEAHKSDLAELVFNFVGLNGDRVLSRTAFEALLVLTLGGLDEQDPDHNDPARQARALFALMDSDRSGAVSRQEALAVLKHAIQTTVKLAMILVEVVHKVLIQEVLGRLVVQVANQVDEDGDGEVSLTELSGFVKQMTEAGEGQWEGPSAVASLCRFVTDGKGALSPQCKSDIKGLRAEAKMLGDILTEAIAETEDAGVTKEEFINMMGGMTAMLLDLFFKIVPPLPDSAYSKRLLPLRPRALELATQIKAKLSTRHEAITEAFFEMIDRDLSGSVTAREFTSAVKLMDPDSAIDTHVEVFFEIVDKDESNTLDPSELIEVAELAAGIASVAVKCFINATGEALEEGAMDQLLLETVAQYIGAEELNEADATESFQDFSGDISQMLGATKGS